MRELTEEQKKQMDDVFNEPLSDRGKTPPKDYNPPKRKEGEGYNEYMARVIAYDAEYRKTHKKAV